MKYELFVSKLETAQWLVRPQEDTAEKVYAFFLDSTGKLTIQYNFWIGLRASETAKLEKVKSDLTTEDLEIFCAKLGMTNNTEVARQLSSKEFKYPELLI